MVACLRFTLVLSVAVAHANHPVFDLPTFTADELASSPSAASQLLHQMSSLGVVAVTGVPGLAQVKGESLEGVAAACLIEQGDRDPLGWRSVLDDGTLRRSVGARTDGHHDGDRSSALSTDPACNLAAAPLRSLVDAASALFFRALDTAAAAVVDPVRQPVMPRDGVADGYRTFAELTDRGTRLEHFHAYQRPAGNDRPSDEPTLALHTDAGLLIAMTTGHFVASPDSALSDEGRQHGLFIELAHGAVVQARAPDDALLFMAGTGAASWLARTPLRAVPHSLVVPDSPQLTRLWHGRMFLPPADALVVSTSPAMPFSQFRDEQRRQVAETAIGGLGCDLGFGVGSPASDGNGGARSRLDVAGTPVTADEHHRQLSDDGCADDEVLCWMQCMPVDDLWCGADAQCVDMVTDEVIDGNIMCPESDTSLCQLECTSQPHNSSSGGFCSGGGLDMYMTGFTSVTESDVACLNLLFKDWTLDNSGKFAGGCIGTILLGVLTEWLTLVRRKTHKQMPSSAKRDVFMIGLYGAQVTLGYFLMLLAMTYSLEIFICVLGGLIVGHGLFNLSAPPPAGTDPCCVGRETIDGELLSPLIASSAATHGYYTLKVEGMTCATCTKTVSSSLRQLHGVVDVSVDLASGVAQVGVCQDINQQALTDAVSNTGFEASVVEFDQRSLPSESSSINPASKEKEGLLSVPGAV